MPDFRKFVDYWNPLTLKHIPSKCLVSAGYMCSATAEGMALLAYYHHSPEAVQYAMVGGLMAGILLLHTSAARNYESRNG